MKFTNYKVDGLTAKSSLTNSEIKELDKENKLNWVGGNRLIADDSRTYFHKENENGKALFMHITGNATYFVAKFK